MSLASRITLWTSCIGTVGVIAFVHYKQYADRAKTHEGVIRDMERQQNRRNENIYVLQQQIELTKHLKEIESQSPTSINN